ncbi:ABC transporter substrate-binding protein [Nocardia pseudobrasiliensis]|uniref:Carbohydrate ABC transporter substrate-binding protein (CUT1 family) n=1 Tax=Nocardia pseudobrasiliensis TaxID=45979 RepID=A0A370HSM3_9NOCA|nr:ABC transporter substrate-binding protein [Nocardia pseudobrasiliensis]RDI61516.1 carbohydrate ABC transporter substrate-binding protein (CUT1 family) [Nocardia pseudobrasiliensis]
MPDVRFPSLSRRGFLGASAAAATGLALTACAGTGGGSKQSGNSNTITFWSNHPGTSKDQEAEIINRFQAQNPDLKVNLIDAGRNYEEVAQKFNAALSGGELPDVVVLSDVWWFNYALNGTIEPLDGHFAAAGVKVDDYVDTFLNDYKFNGKTWALPYSRSTPLFYYNKDVWSKAGLPDRGPESWQEFDEWGPKIQGVVGDGKWAHGWGDAKNYLAWTFQGPNWTFGGSYSDQWKLKFSDPATIAAGNYLRESINNKKYASIRPQIAVDFGTGVVASTIASTGDLKGIKQNAAGKLEFGTAFLPHPHGPGCTTGGAGLAIPARISDQRKANALKFIDFLTNSANTAYFTQATGYIPVRKSAVEDASEKDFLAKNPNSKTAFDQLALTKSQDYARVFLPGGDQIIGTGLEQIGLQNKDVATVFADVSNQLQAIYDRQIAPKLPK